MMNRLPLKDSPSCVFNVVRVCGTMKKVEKEAIRRARIIVLMAHDHSRALAKSTDTLGAIFGGGETEEISMVDVDNSVEDDD